MKHVEEMLRPPVDGETVHCQFVPGALGNNCHVISSQSRQGKRPDDYHDWRFPIKAAPRVWFHYFEIWTRTNLGRHCSLNRAYLHLYIKKERDLDPLLCVHSDPLEQPADPEDERLRWQCEFKRGPHLHVSTAGDLAHCHFPLNYGHLDSVLSSIEDLTKAMADAVQIVRREVVEVYAASPWK
ncbi:MAG: hypothetical protein ACHQ50_13945 [Fimbriimonadales bacterium]